jgi:hypothetical protein
MWSSRRKKPFLRFNFFFENESKYPFALREEFLVSLLNLTRVVRYLRAKPLGMRAWMLRLESISKQWATSEFLPKSMGRHQATVVFPAAKKGKKRYLRMIRSIMQSWNSRQTADRLGPLYTIRYRTSGKSSTPSPESESPTSLICLISIHDNIKSHAPNNALLPDPNSQPAPSRSILQRRDCPTHIRTFATSSLGTPIPWLA